MALRERLVYAIDVVTDGVDTGLNRINKSMKEAEGTTAKLRAGWSAAVKEFKNSREAQGVVIGAAAAVAVKAVNDYSNLQESINAVNVSYGVQAQAVRELGDDSAEAFGMSERAFNEFAVGFSAFADQISTAGGQQVAQVVDDMATRIADFASVHNLSMQEAEQVAKSTLAGETEAFRRFGGDVSAATVETFAYKNGIAEVGTELTEGQKVLARYGLFMEQTAKTAGDFANTSDGLANQQRILTARVEDASAMLGEALYPAAVEAAGALVMVAEGAEYADTGLKKLGTGGLGSSIAGGLRVITKGWQGLADEMANASVEADKAAESTLEAATVGAKDVVNRAINAWEDLTLAVRRHYWEAESVVSSQRLVEDAIDDAVDAFKRQEEAARESRNELREHADATNELYEAEYDLEQAVIDAAEALEDGELSLKGVRSELAKVTEAADRQAQALVTTKGLTMESEAGMRVWAESMLDTAGTLDGPMKAAVMDHISRVTGIPTSVLTTFGVQVDPGALAALEDLLARLGRIANNPFARVSGTGTTGGARIDGPQTGRRVEAAGATGGIINRPTVLLAGERGPEALIPLEDSPGNSPLPMQRSTAASAVAAGPTTNNITQHSHYHQWTVIGAPDDSFVRAVAQRMAAMNRGSV